MGVPVAVSGWQDMDVEGKVVIITGSAQGLGKAFAARLLNAGAKVCLSDLRDDTGAKTKIEFEERYGRENVHFIQCDVTKQEDLVALYDGCEEYFKAKVDIFCNNAGINTALGWRKCMDINIIAVMAGTELAMERMGLDKGGKGGLLVNTASLVGIVPGWNRESYSYFASKHAVVSVTRTLGSPQVYKETGVKVQCICPSFADTAIIDDPDGGSTNRTYLKETFGLLTVEDVSNAYLELIQSCGNGAAIAVVKGSPPILIPEFSYAFMLALGGASMLMSKVMTIKAFKLKHQLASLCIFFVMIYLVLSFITALF